ncbi:MAG: GNAT family N-acetyltransferase [Tissierellaceae bacterium]|nr:GNAT family N-acetyltransferase [Tissierellaceae bacterium]
MKKLDQEVKIVVKKLSKDDVLNNFEEISNLLQQSYKVSFTESQIEKNYFYNKVDSLARYISENKAIIYGAFNKKLIGILWCYPRVFLNEKRLHVNHFVIKDSFRGLGVGTLLIKEVEQHAKNSGIEAIDLMVTSNSPSVKFYEQNYFFVERYQMLKRL